jgi:WS/DGAT/MGAT family acyltransferase
MDSVEKLSGADRAWLLMDRPGNPMMIVGAIVLATPLDLARLRALIADRFLAYSRFRCVPQLNPLGGGTWIQSSGFDLEDHVLARPLSTGAGQPELEALVGELASMPFATGRPLWTFHLVEHYRSGSALIVRIHHAYADGLALLKVLFSLTDEGLEQAPVDVSAGEPQGWLERLGEVLKEGTTLTEKAVHLALHPKETSALAGQTLGAVGEIARLGLLTDDPPTCLKRPLSGRRRVAWGSPLSLKEIRTLAAVLGCTVNDVLMSILAGALGRYLASRGDGVAGLKIRAALPVNLRSGGSPGSLGNFFGLVFVDLPVGIRHPLERLYAIHTGMQSLKGSPQAPAVLGLLTLIGNLPAPLEAPVIDIFSAKASLVASNLLGPQKPLHLSGARIAQLLFWVPQAGDIGTGVSMLSYNGTLQFGVIADRDLVPQPAILVTQIEAEFERLVYLLLLGVGSRDPAVLAAPRPPARTH